MESAFDHEKHRLIRYCWLTYSITGFLGMSLIEPQERFKTHAIFLSFSFLLLLIPWVLCIDFAINWKRQKPSKILPIVAALPSAALAAFLSVSYLYLLNACVGTQEILILEGRVTEKWISYHGASLRSYLFNIDADGLQLSGKASSMEDFADIIVGDRYQRQVIRGGLGYYYTFRWDDSKWTPVHRDGDLR